MAKKEKTLLLRNTTCDFVCPWVYKLDGSNDHRFVKGEIFEVPETIERVRNGEKVKVNSFELLKSTFGLGIEVATGAVSMSNIKEKDDEIARLKAELAKAKKGGKKEDEAEVTHDPEEDSEETTEGDADDNAEGEE